MRISDWSSDVCSSDLRGIERRRIGIEHQTAHREHLGPLDEHVRIFGAISFQRPHHRFDRIIHVEAVELLEVRDGLGLLLKDQEPVAVLERRDRSFRSEEHTSELQSLMRISYAVFCLKKKIKNYTYKKNSTLNNN